MRSEDISLIVVEQKPDKNGFDGEKTLHCTEVFAEEGSISRAEFYAAARAGIKVAKMMLVDKGDFEFATKEIDGAKKKPSIVIHEGETYRIIRTFAPKNGTQMELYLQEEENGGF